MALKEMKRLIRKGESQGLEFTGDTVEVGKSICSFANTNDGVILVGVSDDGGIRGCSPKDEQRIANTAHTCKPSIYPGIEKADIDGKTIFLVKVKKSDQIHSYKNIAYKRVGTHDKPLSADEVIEFARSTGKIQFDSQVCEEAGYGDIDEEKVEEFLEERATKLKVDVPRISIKDFLTKTIKVVKEVNGKLKPTNAALLFFGKDPQEFIPQAEIRIARFKGTTMIEFIDSKILRGDFYEVLEDVELFFKRNTRLASKIVEFKRVDIPEYPLEAIREAVINAIAHRDYFRDGAIIKIAIFDDRVEVDNPGRLVPGLDMNNLEGVHETRNRLICSIFHETKDMERYGTGIRKMMDLMEKYGLKKPSLSQPGDFFKVTFYGPGEDILDLVPSIPPERVSDLSHLNERQIEVLRLIVNESQEMTNSRYRKLFDVSMITAYRDLQQLVKERHIRERGRYKDRMYYAE